MSNDPPRGRHLPPGYDEIDPYWGETLGDYPDWWRKNIHLFREYDLRPYRPSRFADDEPVPIVVKRLESRFDVTIDFRSKNPHTTETMEISVDLRPVGTVDRTREADGFTRYGVSSDEFRSLIERHLDR